MQRTGARSASVAQTIMVLSAARGVIGDLFLVIKVHLAHQILLLVKY